MTTTRRPTHALAYALDGTEAVCLACADETITVYRSVFSCFTSPREAPASAPCPRCGRAYDGPASLDAAGRIRAVIDGLGDPDTGEVS